MATRLEKVIVDLDDRFSRPAVQMAASAALFRRELDKSNVNVTRFSQDNDRAGKSIDRFSGRISVMAQVAGALGPALLPISAVAIPAVAGLAAQFGFAALAGGTAIAAFQGVGDALKAMNKAHLEPTTQNLQAAKIAMQDISPAARDFVRQLQDMAPAMKELRDTAASGMFPGVTEGLDSMSSLFPKFQRILGAVSGELGDIAEAAGGSLASARWADFFDFLATDAPSALSDMAAATGNVTHALAEMWMAFDPMNDDFSSWLVDVTAKFDDWATSLSGTDGFAEFMAYISQMGPQVGETLGSLANALLQIVEAAAPIGGPVLSAIEAFADAVAAIADSDLGTPIFGMVAALSALNLAMRTTSALSKASFGGPMVTQIRSYATGFTSAFREVRTATDALRQAELARSRVAVQAQQAQFALLPASEKRGAVSSYMTAARQQEDAAKRLVAAERARSAALRETAAVAGKTAAVVGGLALASTGAADSLGLTNTVSLGLMGTLAGPWGAAAGAASGLLIDIYHSGDEAAASITRLNAAVRTNDLASMNAALADTQKQLEDFKNVSNAGDMFSDIKKQISATMRGDFLGKDLENAVSAGFGAINGAAAANALTNITDGFAKTSAAAARATGSVVGFLSALDALNGNLTKREGLRAYTESLLNARAAIKETGKTLTANGDAFKGHARAGLESQRMLDRVAASALNVAKDMKPLEAQRYLKNARQDFVQVAHGMGMSRVAAKALAGQLLTLGGGASKTQTRVQKLRAEIAGLKSKSVKLDEKGAAAARDRIAALRGEIARLQGKTITITTVRRQVGAGATAGGSLSARGNLFHYAYGDVADRHMPELAGPGGTRVWREPETQGEAYIPLANDDRRPRARAIAEETVGLLGGDVEWYARGGRRGGGDGNGGNDSPRKRHFAELTKALQSLKQTVDKRTAARDAIVEKRNSLASTVTGAFTSDPFAGGNVWQGGGGNPLGILKADIAKANAFKGVLYGLSKQGLDGDAMAAIASTGDINKAQALLATGKKGVGAYEAAFNQRAAAVAGVGAYAGSAAYAAQQAAANKLLTTMSATLKRQEAELKHMRHENKGHARDTGDRVAKGVNSAAAAGKRKRK